jgi:hypothetical protein
VCVFLVVVSGIASIDQEEFVVRMLLLKMFACVRVFE